MSGNVLSGSETPRGTSLSRVNPSEHETAQALQAAARNRDTVSVTSIWRALTPAEQEDLLFALLSLPTEVRPNVQLLESEEGSGPLVADPGDTAAMDVVVQTELIPKVVEDLQGLTGAQNHGEAPSTSPPTSPDRLAQYWSRWRRRWRLSALVGAAGVTAIFARTADTSTFGPMEWFVAVFGALVGGGVFVGTLLNFASAAWSRSQRHTTI